MEDAEVKQSIFDFLEKKSKTKKMHYLSDIAKGIGLKKREIKKVVQAMIEAGEIEPWSSGSTTYYMLPGSRDVENL
ncbi:MAG: sulfite reductase [Deltaproteobacteria bacterium]|nr:sulfite reductase [Deltaproteobacteria bacterium]MBW2050970.1 sulfite reductase [Deltaproteobacteria bacterium]MBW2141867.1 sulfite reductase [Deltaproteobacteria bacterium]MBW2322248.1 sulfite reductase [Deltaproteobacteria bacterium]